MARRAPGRRADPPPTRRPPAPQGPKRPAPASPRRPPAPQGPKRPTFGNIVLTTPTSGGYNQYGYQAPYGSVTPVPNITSQFPQAQITPSGPGASGFYEPLLPIDNGAGLVGMGGGGPSIGDPFYEQVWGGGGGGEGGGGFYVPEGPTELPDISTIKWKQGNFNLQDSKAPGWWKSLIPENAADMERPDVAYIAMLNTMIPYLSPEDQKRAAGLIYETVGGANFGHYEKVDVQAPITRATANLSQLNLPVIDTQYYQSASRGSGAVNALSQLREQTVGGEREKIGGTGIGYRFLQDLLAQIEQFGGKAGEGQTRSQQLAMQGAFDPLYAQLNSPEIGPVGAIAQMLGTPFFSQGSLSPFTRQGNKVFFGQPNPVLF